MRFFIYHNSVLATICSMGGAAFIALGVTAMISGELDILSGIIALAIGLGLMWLGSFISTRKAEKKRDQARQNTGAAKAPVYTPPRQCPCVTKPANKIAIAAAILFLLAAATEFWATESTRAFYTNIAQPLNSENVMLIGMGVVLMAAALRTKQVQEVSVLFVLGFLGLTFGSLDVTLVNWRNYATLVYEINTLFQYTSETLFRAVAWLLMLLLAVLSLPKCKARTGVVVKWLWALPIILLTLAYIKLFADGRISVLLQRMFYPRWIGLKHTPREMLDALAQLMVLAATLLSSLCFRRLACKPVAVFQQQILLEKERIRQQQLAQAQKRQQEIAELERKLKEIKSQTPAMPEDVRGDSFVMREPFPAAQPKPSNKICPRCHQSNMPDSMFCAGCGKQLTAK